jgi:hypothetical protein
MRSESLQWGRKELNIWEISSFLSPTLRPKVESSSRSTGLYMMNTEQQSFITLGILKNTCVKNKQETLQ